MDRPAHANASSPQIFKQVIDPCTRAVWLDSKHERSRKPTKPLLPAPAQNKRLVRPDNLSGAIVYLANANAEAALGTANPIRNETHPDKNAGNGPYAS